MYQIIRDLEHQARNIQWLEFELSNHCQYSKKHTWCPRSQDKRPLIFLRTNIVHKVIDFFQRYDFAGRIYFSGYSEPLIDPRLTELVHYAKKHLPRCNIDMFTNGIACDENLLADILDAGVDRIKLSVYDVEEHERLSAIVKRMPRKGVRLQPRKIGNNPVDIDCRMGVYDNLVSTEMETPCFMPTLYYFVRNDGTVNLCFWDWKYTETFGNLYKDSIESTLMHERRLIVNDHLVNGRRFSVPVCIGCTLPTDKCISEYKKRMNLCESV